MTTTVPRALGLLALVLLAGLLLAACQDDSPGVTHPTMRMAQGAELQTTAISSSHSGSEDGSADDDEDDNDSGEDDHSGNGTGEDPSGEDPDDEGGPQGDVDGSEVRGLFFGIEACPAVPDCVLALRIKDTLVVVTNGTEIVNEPAGESPVSPLNLAVLIGSHPGLPMKAKGSSESGALIADRLRIEDEIQATGEVVAGAPGCDFGLTVLVELCFEVSPGVTAPAVGSTVRVEGTVPSDFALPFLATEVEPED